MPAKLERYSLLLLAAVGGSACLASVSPDGRPEDVPDVGPGGMTPTLGSGAELWAAQCASCHGDFGPGTALSSGNAAGDFRLDVSAALERHGDGLEVYIQSAMPLGNVAACGEACAQATGSYLRSKQVAPPPARCTGEEGPARGERVLSLLDSDAYQASLEDVLGIPAGFGARVAHGDGLRGGFVDMKGKAVSGTSLDLYRSNAQELAVWAVGEGRPFACPQSACKERFVDEFLPRLFRGAVPDGQREAYLELFETYPNEGLQLALQAALASPHFLYRIEAGQPLEVARAEGWYEGRAIEAPTPSGRYRAEGQPIETVRAAQLGTASDGRQEGDSWALFENGRIRFAFAQPLSDPSIVRIHARGTNHGAVWPELTVRVADRTVGVLSLEHRDNRAHELLVEGVSGIEWVELVFANDSGVPPYDEGNDANVFVARVELWTGASVVEAGDTPPEPEPVEEDLLEAAPADSFALSPFEIATALAYRLTGSTPDDQLLEAARRGALVTKDGLRSEAERLLASPRGRARLGDFAVQWFRLEGVLSAQRPDVPELSSEVKAAMLEEVRQHFLHVFEQPDVPWSAFYAADETFVNRALAQFYELQGNFGDDFVRTEVSGRGGPIASGAFMTVNAHAERSAPILRAVRARETALCQFIDPPNSPIAGEDIDAQRAAAQARVAEREQAGALSSREFYFLYTDGIDACAGCHEKTINPNFGMEDFDHVGRLRPSSGEGTVLETIGGTEIEVAIDGVLHGVASTADSESIAYAGAKDLSRKIADTEAVKTCLARKSFRFLSGQPPSDRDLDPDHAEVLDAERRSAYACAMAEALEAFENAGDSPRELFLHLTTDSLLWLRH